MCAVKMDIVRRASAAIVNQFSAHKTFSPISKIDNQQIMSKWFKWALITNGCDLLRDLSRGQRLVCKCFTVLNVLSNVYRIALNISLIISGISVFRDLLFIAIAVCGIIAVAQLKRNGKQIAHTLKSMAARLEPMERQQLLQLQSQYALMCFFATLSEVTRRCLLLYDEGNQLIAA